MKAGGNLKSNAYYNPDERRNPYVVYVPAPAYNLSLSSFNRPPHAAAYIDEGDRNSAMEKFIRQKYERKAFVGQAAPATPAKPPIANRPPQTSAPRASPAPTVASSSSSGHGAAQSIPRPGTAPLPEPRAAPEPVPPVPTDAASYAANRSLPFRAPPSAPILGPSRAVSLPVTAAPSGHSNPFSQSVGPPSYMAAVQPQFQPPQAPAPPPPRTDGVWGDLLQLSPGAVQYTSQLSFMGSSQPQPFAPSYVTQLQAFAGVHQPPGSFGPQPGFASSSFAPTNPFAQPAFQTQQMQMQSQPGVQYGTNPFLTMQTAQQPQQPQQYYAQQPMHGQQPFY